MPPVSVLLPCYNAAATLAEALDSVIQPDFQDFEIEFGRRFGKWQLSLELDYSRVESHREPNEFVFGEQFRNALTQDATHTNNTALLKLKYRPNW